MGLGLTREDGKDKTIKELEAEIAANTPETEESERAEDEEPSVPEENTPETNSQETAASDVAETSGYDLSVFEGNAAVAAIARFRNTGDGSALEALLDKATGK